jgi:uncharacterized protein (TIGR02147 family)
MLKSDSQTQTNEFRLLLQRELVARVERNPKYSLRAFARDLGVTAPVLSHLLSGKRSLNEKVIMKLGLAMAMDPSELQLHLRRARETSTSTGTSAAAEGKDAHFSTLTLDVFNSISDWYHDAILELTRVSGFRDNRQWIARVLGISVAEVNTAVERLVRLDLLKIDKNGTWVDLSKNNSTHISADFTSAALRKYQEKILELSAQALKTVDKSYRDHTSVMLAIDTSDLEEVKAKIAHFRRNLTRFLERKDVQPDQVYQLAVSFFPLTKIESNKTGESL